MLGLESIPFWNSQKINKQNIMLFRFWRMLLRPAGRFFHGHSAKVSHDCVNRVIQSLNRFNIFSNVLLGIKKYIVGLIIKTSSDSSSLSKEKVYLGKLNMILVQVTVLFTVIQLSSPLSKS